MKKITKWKNVTGTAKNDPWDGSQSWREFHDTYTRRKIDMCQKMRCLETEKLEGSHVMKVDSDDQAQYIVILCHKHNEKTVNEHFRLKKYAPQIPVNRKNYEKRKNGSYKLIS